jgi:hypothetical protein
MIGLDRIVTKRPKFSIPDDWDAALKRVSERTGITEAELHRRALKALLESYGENVDSKILRGGKRTSTTMNVDTNDDPTAED